MARVPYRTRAVAAGQDQEIFDRLERERRTPTPNIFLALANAPDQLDGLLTYSASLRSATELGPRLRELAIMAVASAKGGEYVVEHHLADAVKIGLTEEQVRAIGVGAEAAHFDELETAVIRLGRAAGIDGDVTAEEWDAVAAHLDDKQMVQLALTICWYVNGVLMMKMLALDLEDSYTTRRPNT